MILGLILIAILCCVAIAGAYDTSGDKHIIHEIAAAHVSGEELPYYYEALEDQQEQMQQVGSSPKWSTEQEIRDGYAYYQEQMQQVGSSPKWSTEQEIRDGYAYYQEQIQVIQQTVESW